MQKTRNNIQILINQAFESGLSEKDIKIATEYLQQNEYGLCLDHIATHLFEFNIPINASFYSLVLEISDLLHISNITYSFLSDLIAKNNRTS